MSGKYDLDRDLYFRRLKSYANDLLAELAEKQASLGLDEIIKGWQEYDAEIERLKQLHKHAVTKEHAHEIERIPPPDMYEAPEPPEEEASTNICTKHAYTGDKECPWCRIEALELELSEMIKGWQEYQAGLGDE